MGSNSIREMCKLMMLSLCQGLGKIRYFSIYQQAVQYLEIQMLYAIQITELCRVPIARCVPHILGCLHHHDWLNMVHNMTRLAQFSQQMQVHTVLLRLRMLGDLSYYFYCPSIYRSFVLKMRSVVNIETPHVIQRKFYFEKKNQTNKNEKYLVSS